MEARIDDLRKGRNGMRGGKGKGKGYEGDERVKGYLEENRYYLLACFSLFFTRGFPILFFIIFITPLNSDLDLELWFISRFFEVSSSSSSSYKLNSFMLVN